MIFSARAQNFKSYKDLLYTVEAPGLVAVEGAWDSNQEKSCGSGKTTLLCDLLCWALYGETVDGETKVCYRGASSRCEVELRLPFVSLVRSQAADGTKNKLEIEGIKHRKLEDAKAYLARLVPPKKVFTSTIILGQGVGERFTGWKPAERARIFAELLALSLWSAARRNLGADLRAFSEKSSRALATADALQQQSDVMMAAAAGPDVDADDVGEELAKLDAGIRHDTEQADAFRAELSRDQATQATQLVQYTQLQNNLGQVEKELKLLSSGKCPTCQRKWPKRTIEGQRTALQGKQKNLKAEMSALKKATILDGRLQCTKNHLDFHLRQLSERQPRAQELRALLARAQGIEEQAVEALGRAEDARKEAAAADAEVALLQTLDRAFYEIPLRKIDGVLTLMNRSLATICRDIWDSEFFVQLTSEKQLKRGETVPEIGLQVTNRAGSYSSSSWGQKRMIDISVQLALRHLLLSCWRNRLPLLICDDVMDVLDPPAKQRLHQNLLLPESARSAVFVLYADRGLPQLARRVVVGYNQTGGSYIRACETPGGLPPVVSFYAVEETASGPT